MISAFSRSVHKQLSKSFLLYSSESPAEVVEWEASVLGLTSLCWLILGFKICDHSRFPAQCHFLLVRYYHSKALTLEADMSTGKWTQTHRTRAVLWWAMCLTQSWQSFTTKEAMSSFEKKIRKSSISRTLGRWTCVGPGGLGVGYGVALVLNEKKLYFLFSKWF